MSVLFDDSGKGQDTFNHGQEKTKTGRVHDSLLRKKIGFESLGITSNIYKVKYILRISGEKALTNTIRTSHGWLL